MSLKLTTALTLPILAITVIANAYGWLGDVFTGALLDQLAVVAAGALAEAIVPGSGAVVVNALEAWLTGG